MSVYSRNPLLTSPNSTLRAPAKTNGYFRKSLAHQSPEAWQVNLIAPVSAFGVSEKKCSFVEEDLEGRIPGSAEKSRMDSSTPDVNIPHHLYPLESPQNTQTSEQAALKASSPPDANAISCADYFNHLPIAQPQPVLATAYYSKFTNVIEYGGYSQPTKLPMRSSAGFHWVVNYVVVCMLKPNTNCKKSICLSQLVRELASPWIKNHLDSLQASDSIVCLALHYIDLLFQDGEFARTQQALKLNPLDLALAISRCFGIALHLASIWFWQDFRKPPRMFHSRSQDASMIFLETNMLQALGYIPMGELPWIHWLTVLSDMSSLGHSSPYFNRYSVSETSDLEAWIAVQDLLSKLPRASFDEDDYFPNRVDPDRVPDVVVASFVGLSSFREVLSNWTSYGSMVPSGVVYAAKKPSLFKEGE